MPFPNVTKHGIERNFEQVLNSISARVAPLLASVGAAPDKEGWTIEDDLAALEAMVADSSDKLWTAAIDDSGNSRAALLEARVAAAGGWRIAVEILVALACGSPDTSPR